MIIEIILGVLLILESYVVWNLMRKTEVLESWVEGFNEMIISVNTELKLIDTKGSFQSDDETGAIFKQIQQTVNKLNDLRGEDVNDK
jgi:hypothetical protein|tara:strand:- start:815 stop:1075 length:261 start_codon:yes stop_codon:yes gene_type:complete